MNRRAARQDTLVARALGGLGVVAEVLARAPCSSLRDSARAGAVRLHLSARLVLSRATRLPSATSWLRGPEEVLDEAAHDLRRRRAVPGVLPWIGVRCSHDSRASFRLGRSAVRRASRAVAPVMSLPSWYLQRVEVAASCRAGCGPRRRGRGGSRSRGAAPTGSRSPARACRGTPDSPACASSP
jgi:hypothetical protein